MNRPKTLGQCAGDSRDYFSDSPGTDFWTK